MTTFPEVYDYSTALAAHRRSRGRDRIKVGNNTYLLAAGDSFAIRYHATDVVTYHPDGTIETTTGGYETSTTVLRLNRHTPAWLKFYRRNFAVQVDDASVSTSGPMPSVYVTGHGHDLAAAA